MYRHRQNKCPKMDDGPPMELESKLREQIQDARYMLSRLAAKKGSEMANRDEGTERLTKASTTLKRLTFEAAEVARRDRYSNVRAAEKEEYEEMLIELKFEDLSIRV